MTKCQKERSRWQKTQKKAPTPPHNQYLRLSHAKGLEDLSHGGVTSAGPRALHPPRNFDPLQTLILANGGSADGQSRAL